MKTKILKIQITEEDFPMLFKIDKEHIGDVCYDILENGYENIFPEINNKNNKMDNGIINKIDKVSDILEELIGINSNSNKKGKISENIIYQAIKNKHKDYVLEETRKRAHCGDGILNIPVGKNNNTRVMLEIKNYNSVVNKDEINKLKFDMKYMNINFALIISMKSGFIGKKQMSIETFLYNQKQYTIVYLPNLFGQMDKLDACFILLEKLIQLNLNNNENNNYKLREAIKDHLGEINSIFDDLNNNRQKYLMLEDNIKKSLNNYYLDMRANESNIKNKINNIWKSIDDEFKYCDNKSIKEKLTKLLDESTITKKLKDLFELFLNNNYEIATTIKNKLWTVIKNDTIIMTIEKKIKDIEIKKDKTIVKLNLLENHQTFQKKLIKVEKKLLI